MPLNAVDWVSDAFVTRAVDLTAAVVEFQYDIRASFSSFGGIGKRFHLFGRLLADGASAEFVAGGEKGVVTSKFSTGL